MFAHARAETAISPESQMHLRPWRRLTLWAYAPDFAPSQKTGWGDLLAAMGPNAAQELKTSRFSEEAALIPTRTAIVERLRQREQQKKEDDHGG
jgi:hypothetical protein